MAKSQKATDPRLENFPKKWAKTLENDEEFLDKAQQSSKKELDELILKAQELLVDFEKDQDADQNLQELKEQLKEAGAIYKDGIKINKARSAYCVFLKRSH